PNLLHRPRKLLHPRPSLLHPAASSFIHSRSSFIRRRTSCIGSGTFWIRGQSSRFGDGSLRSGAEASGSCWKAVGAEGKRGRPGVRAPSSLLRASGSRPRGERLLEGLQALGELGVLGAQRLDVVLLLHGVERELLDLLEEAHLERAQVEAAVLQLLGARHVRQVLLLREVGAQV